MSETSDAFVRARALWGRFRAGLEGNPAVLGEMLGALRLILNDYSTTLRENRFLVGGAAERLVAITMRAVGLQGARARGLRLDEEDLVVEGCRISLKCSFTAGKSAIRLVNALGSGSGHTWDVPTLFLLGGRGIGYADAGLLPDAVMSTGDALILDGQKLARFFEASPAHWYACAVPTKPADPHSIRAASELVVRDVVLRGGGVDFPLLAKHL